MVCHFSTAEYNVEHIVISQSNLLGETELVLHHRYQLNYGLWEKKISLYVCCCTGGCIVFYKFQTCMFQGKSLALFSFDLKDLLHLPSFHGGLNLSSVIVSRIEKKLSTLWYIQVITEYRNTLQKSYQIELTVRMHFLAS